MARLLPPSLRLTGTSRPTATRDLADLVAKGALTRTGQRKGTRDP